jgi:hypothetical protein
MTELYPRLLGRSSPLGEQVAGPRYGCLIVPQVRIEGTAGYLSGLDNDAVLLAAALTSWLAGLAVVGEDEHSDAAVAARGGNVDINGFGQN